jgi:hypothetical protein
MGGVGMGEWGEGGRKNGEEEGRCGGEEGERKEI